MELEYVQGLQTDEVKFNLRQQFKKVSRPWILFRSCAVSFFQISINTCLRELIFVHQIFNQYAGTTLFPQFLDLRVRQFSLRSKLNSLFFSFIVEVRRVIKARRALYYGFKLHLAIIERGEILDFYITAANVDERQMTDWITQ